MKTDMKTWNWVLGMVLDDQRKAVEDALVRGSLTMDDLIREQQALQGDAPAKKIDHPEAFARLRGEKYDEAIIDEAKPLPRRKVGIIAQALKLPVAPPSAPPKPSRTAAFLDQRRQVLCACGCKESVVPSPRWGAYVNSAHMMRAARLAERDGFTVGSPLQLLSQRDPQASRELELIDTLAATKLSADNVIGKLRDELAMREKELQVARSGPVPHFRLPPKPAKPQPTLAGFEALEAENDRLREALLKTPDRPEMKITWTRGLEVPRGREALQQGNGKTAVAAAPAFVHPRAIRALPVMSGGGFRAPRPVMVACQSEDDFPFSYVED